MTAYTQNAALIAADFGRSPIYGWGRIITGVKACAEFNDEQLEGPETRIELGITLDRVREASAYFDLLLEYAECFKIEEGANVRMAPDTTGNAVITFGSSTIVRDTLRLVPRGIENAPTEVEIRYTDSTGVEGDPWADQGAKFSLPGVEEGSIPRIPSVVRMPGVHRFSEAFRKAKARLYRTRIAGSYSFVTTDERVVTQVGDLANLSCPEVGLSSRVVRIVGTTMIAPGRYQISADDYTGLAYPDDVVSPPETTTVPDGMIGLLHAGETPPSGWSFYTAAEGEIIRCRNMGIGNITGGGDVVRPAGETQQGGAHTGSNSFWTELITPNNPGGGSVRSGLTGTINEAGEHTHPFASLNFGTLTPASRRYRLVQKNGSASLVHRNVAVLAGAAISSAILTPLTTHAGWLLAAGAPGNFGANSANANQNVNNADAHAHGTWWNNGWYVPSFSFQFQRYLRRGAHNHSFTQTATIRPRRRRLLLYGGTEDYPVVPGMIFLWAGSLASLPSGWHLCDGNNGTLDLTDYFIEIATAVNVGQAAGNNTVLFEQATTTNSTSHNHTGELASDNSNQAQARHSDNAGIHSHSVPQSTISYTARNFALAAIMFTGT